MTNPTAYTEKIVAVARPATESTPGLYRMETRYVICPAALAGPFRAALGTGKPVFFATVAGRVVMAMEAAMA